MDLDTRLLRYFAAVAEEGSLTLAARRLFVSQPALTKQIRQLETQLGATLFTRSRTGMALTDAGRALAARVPELLTGLDRAVSEVRTASARAERVLRVGFIASAANEATPRIIADFTARRPDWRIEMRQAAWSNPSAGLAEGQVDVGLLRLPIPDRDRLRTRALFTEPRWIVLPTGHPAAAHDVVPLSEVWDEPFAAAMPESGEWRDYWLAADAREGRPVRIGAVADQPDEWLSAIANGYGIAIAPASAARFYARPGIVFRPLSGVCASTVAVAWAPADDHDPVVQSFVEACVDTCARP